MNPQIIKAINFAFASHNGQMRKYTNLPYIMHPVRVSMRVSRIERATDEMICAAVLHDVLEDTPVEYDEILSEFGEKVASLVSQLTNTTKGLQFPRSVRRRMDHDRIEKCSGEAKLIKLCDRLDNISEISGAKPDFQKLYAKETISLLKAIGDIGADGDALKSEIMGHVSKYE